MWHLIYARDISNELEKARYFTLPYCSVYTKNQELYIYIYLYTHAQHMYIEFLLICDVFMVILERYFCGCVLKT